MDERYIDAQRLLTKHLIENEYVIWEGQPGMRHLLNVESVFVSLVTGGFFGGFAIALFSTLFSHEHSQEGIEYVFGVILFAIAIYFVFFIYILERKNRKKTYYFLTNKRAFIIRNQAIEIIEDVKNHEYSIVHLKYGNITIDFDPSIFSQRTKLAGSNVLRLAFLDIQNGMNVLELIKLGTYKEKSTYITYQGIPLTKDENILWKSKPSLNHLLYPGEIRFIIFASIWTLGLGIMVITRIGIEGMISYFPITIIPILMFVVGLYLMIGRFILEYYRRKNITYLITTHKVIIRESTSQKMYTKDDMQIKLLHLFKGGSGIIQLVEKTLQINIRGFSANQYIAGISDASSVLIVDEVDVVMSLLLHLK